MPTLQAATSLPPSCLLGPPVATTQFRAQALGRALNWLCSDVLRGCSRHLPEMRTSDLSSSSLGEPLWSQVSSGERLWKNPSFPALTRYSPSSTFCHTYTSFETPLTSYGFLSNLTLDFIPNQAANFSPCCPIYAASPDCHGDPRIQKSNTVKPDPLSSSPNCSSFQALSSRSDTCHLPKCKNSKPGSHPWPFPPPT